MNKDYIFKLYYNRTNVHLGRWYGPNNMTAHDLASIWGRGGKPLGRCSEDCRPGSYRLVGTSTCCWNCPMCPTNTVSSVLNAKGCESCHPDLEVFTTDIVFFFLFFSHCPHYLEHFYFFYQIVCRLFYWEKLK